MNIKKMLKAVLFTAVILANGAAFAYSPDELKKECHKPKFTDFTLTEYKAPENIETAPESEFSFRASAFTNPTSIKLTIKNQKIPFTVESTSSFHQVNAKLPAEYTGKYVRLNVTAAVFDGICHEEMGWLLKITDKKPAEATPATTEPAPVAAPAQANPEPAK
jgi:hypothetical protein